MHFSRKNVASRIYTLFQNKNFYFSLREKGPLIGTLFKALVIFMHEGNIYELILRNVLLKNQFANVYAQYHIEGVFFDWSPRPLKYFCAPQHQI